MSIIDLQKRSTSNRELFGRFVRSSDSLVFFEGEVPQIDDPPGSVDLAVGSRWFETSQTRFYSIEESGLVVRPHTCIVIEVANRIALPHNVMGIVTGKGRYIFKSAMISTGKIDPGFDGRLRIGFFNASKQPIHLKKGDKFCTCCFLSTESEALTPKPYQPEPPAQSPPIPFRLKAQRFFLENWKFLVPTAIAIASLLSNFFRTK
jgi:dCTP deaminase